MLDLLVDWDGDIGSGTQNSSHRSSISSGTGRCSFSDAARSSTESLGPPIVILSSSSNFKKRSLHRWSSDPAWNAIIQRPNPVGPHDFRLIHRIGSGDIGTVYLCHLQNEEEMDHRDKKTSSNPLLYAMKVVDKRELEKKKKLGRAEVERRILRSLDHPFLPTLYAEFDVDPHYSCVIMEYCPAGDLHSLRHRQPTKRFDYYAARFYASEVLVALEYLHMMGIIYRDLKPENILIRSDGHIMLSDFDLSLECPSSPTLDTLPLPPTSSSLSCCLLPFFLSKKKKKKNGNKNKPLFVAEPVEARSNSLVGTHEYVAPEMAVGMGHGSAVDWWAFGVFVYELLCGRTPFVGSKSTICNIVRKPLAFPQSFDVDPRARDLITRLLVKDPTYRLGARRGAADVKAHPFFSGVNFALLRSQKPPVIPTESAPSQPKWKPKLKPKSFWFDYF